MNRTNIPSMANRVEVWRLTDEGLVTLHTKPIFGTISMLQCLQPKGETHDILFIGTDRLTYFNVGWDPDRREMVGFEQKLEDTAEIYMRQSQSQNKCLTDPTGRFMIMHLWEGVINVCRLPTRKGHTTKLEVLAQVRLTELWVRTSAFIHSRDGHPRIAFLYQTKQNGGKAKVAIYRLTSGDKDSEAGKFDPNKDRELDKVIGDPQASMLIPVPLTEEKRYHVRNNEDSSVHLGGLFVVGETLITYIDSLTHNHVSQTVSDPKIYVAWAEYDGTNFLLADDYGRLDLLSIETDGNVVTGIHVTPLSFADGSNQTSRAAQLVYLDDDMLFLCSQHGDSQLLRLHLESQSMELVQNISNNGPILDFSIMDMGNREGDAQAGNAFSSGQARVVAGCGAYQDGTLRSIRSGVGLEDYGLLDEVEDVQGLFTLRSNGSEKDDTICASFLNETRVFCFDASGDIEEVYDFQGLKLDAQTLVAANLSNGNILQITPRDVRLLDSESGISLSTWKAPEEKQITAASANAKWALLAVEGQILVSLNLLDNLASQERDIEQNSEGTRDQISCLHAGRYPLDIGAIGWWSSGTISIVDLSTLDALHGESLRQSEDSACVPRDIALVQLHPQDDAGPTLLIATEDGNIITFNVAAKGFMVSGRKTVTLGTGPARLHILPRGHGTNSIFATTEQASLIYSAEGRIIYSATTADDATFVTHFDSEAFPNSIVLSTNEHIRLSRVDKERLTHVKPLSVKETVRRVAYSPNTRAFGLGCIKKELVGVEEKVTSSFKLVDEILFEPLGKPFLLEASSGVELVECVIRAELVDSTGQPAERFIVGTSYLADPEVTDGDKARGRILVLSVDQDRQINQIVSHKLKGSCRCLAVLESGHIVAALSKTVIVYGYVEETPASGSLYKLAWQRAISIPVDLDISGNTIGVADLKQSLTLMEFTPPREGSDPSLAVVAMHQEAAWSTATCGISDDQWLEADAQGNLMVLRRNREAPTKQGQMAMEMTSEMNVGEQINRIRKLNVAPAENAIVHPKAFLGSVSLASRF